MMRIQGLFAIAQKPIFELAYSDRFNTLLPVIG